MIIEMDDDESLDRDALNFDDFDTDDLDSETPERIAKAFRKLVEEHEYLERAMRLRIKALTAVGLTFDVSGDGPFICDRDKALAGHARMLAELDAEAGA